MRVIAPIAWTDEWAARRKGQAGLGVERRSVWDGVEAEHPRYLFPPRLFRGWHGRCFRASVRGAFERNCAEFKPDLIYAPWIYPDGWAGVELAFEAGLPVVVKAFGSDVLLLDRYPGKVARTAEAVRRADAVIAVSQDLARRIAALGADPEKVSVIYDGVETETFRPGPRSEARSQVGLPEHEPLILFVGNLVPVKAPEVLIEACAALAKAGRGFTCRFIGQGPLRSALERQAARLGIADRVQFLGPLPHDQLPVWYRAADVLALPSRSEGVPNVLLEAAACGTPFVASRVGGIPEIVDVGPNTLVLPGDAAALADALAYWLGRPQSASTGDAPRSTADTVAEMEAVFEHVLQRRRQSADADAAHSAAVEGR